MGIVCVEDHLLVHFSDGTVVATEIEMYLESMLILRIASAGVAVALEANR